LATVLSRQELRRYPYRGVYKLIAEEMGVTQQYVVKAIWSLRDRRYLQKLQSHVARIDFETKLALTSKDDAIHMDGLILLNSTSARP